MAVNRLTFSNDLKAKDLNYPDNFFTLKSEKITPSDSFSFNSYEAFKDLNDFKTNNYSNLFLTKKQKNSDWLKANTKKGDELMGIATTLSWYAYDLKDEEELGSWLYFSKNYEMFDFGLKKVDTYFTYGRPTKNYYNYIFYIDFIDENICTISHTFGDIMFYLCVNDDKSVCFSKEIKDKNNEFVYVIDENKLKLYKVVNHKVYNDNDEIVGSYNKLYQIAIKRDVKNKSAEMILQEDTNVDSDENICYVTNNKMNYDFYIDASWVGYDRSQYISSIDQKKMVNSLESQALIHHQYNKDGGFNFIPLKNNLTYKGNSVRGNNTNISDDDYPDVDYRIYTSINSGLEQEKGNDTIILNFTFVDQEYLVKDGDDLYFTIPEKSFEENNLMEPLWPYKYININDTKFVKNGAFGSNVPYFADKIKKLQNHESDIKNPTDNKTLQFPNNASYLCSWLYKKDLESEPVWLDRYYYPDMIKRNEALYGITDYKQSFENNIDKHYIDKINVKGLYTKSGNDYNRIENDEYKVLSNIVSDKLHKRTYFDKISDIVIEPASTYRYQRISTEMVNEVCEDLEKYRVKTFKSKQGNNVDMTEEFLFDNEHYLKINHDEFKKTNAINFNTNIYLTRKNRIGLQLFGQDYCSGFNIQNRKDLVPFHYYATDKVVYLLNNKFDIVHLFDLGEKYDDVIYKLILGNVFDDVVIVTGQYLYFLTYDLQLKSKISLIDEQAIKNIENISADGTEEKGRKIINYPYGNKSFELKRRITKEKGFKTKNIKKEQKIEIDRFLIALNRIIVTYVDGADEGYLNIPSVLSEMLCQGNPIIHKNNIFVPLNQRIMKLILSPNTEKDYAIFTEKDRETYPACARVLDGGEFYINYKKLNDGANDEDIIGIESSFIKVENKIKNIYIDEDDIVYGLNFDDYAISKDGDTISGLYSSEVYINEGGWWWLFNQSLSKMISNEETAKYAEWGSPNSIDKVKINEDGYMCLIRNFNNLQDNENENNNKRMDIYDVTKSIVYTQDLSSYDKVISLDVYNYIDELHEEHKCFTALCSSYGYIHSITYQCDSKKIIFRELSVPSSAASCFYETVNSNNNLRWRNKNALYFNLHIPSHYVYDNVATIKWSLDDIQDGWYNINAEVDLDAAKFEVKINDIVYQTINEQTHPWFKPYVASNGNIFDMTYYIGNLGKKYGTTLNKILNNSPFDPYTCKESKIEDLKIYTKSLSLYEYQAMRMKGKQINDLILTLPCGNRNSLDEMVRYFKYVSSPSISNKIKINVSGTGLKTDGEFDMLRKEIMSALENQMDCLVQVEDIEFIEIGQND